MKRLHLQFQPERSPGLDVATAVARLRQVGERLASRVWLTEGFDHGRYVNIDFAADDLAGLWAGVREVLWAIPGLSGAAIVCCHGQNGWDDYLLLHHFDLTEPLDDLE